MATGIINQPVDEFFTVINSSGNFVTGIDSTAFTIYIYNPSDAEVSASVNTYIIEVGNGVYKLIFTPNVNGTWFIMITHPEYFPSGKVDEIQVSDGDITTIYDDIQKLLGLSHRNFYMDNTNYDGSGNLLSARIRTYDSSANVGTDTGVLETYLVEADATGPGTFNYFKQIVV